MFGHFLNERGGLIIGKVENGEGIDSIVERSGKEDSFVVEVLLDFVEVLLGTGSDCCAHFF